MLTVCLPSSQSLLKEFLSHLQFVEKIITVGEQEDSATVEFVKGNSLFDGSTLQRCIERTTTPYLLLVLSKDQISTSAHALTRMIDVASDTRAGIVYGDYHDVIGSNWNEHPCNDYQDGSVRDTFDFGPFVLVRMEAARNALQKYGAIPPVRRAGFYDLRLKISIDHAIFHLQEFLSSKSKRENQTSGEQQFDYVDPSNSAVQKEMEEIFTHHLKRIGAYLPPVFQGPLRTAEQFPVKASVIIPVRNRKNVIADALESVLSQVITFPFN
ncbi:MAG: glycosyltransferase, partial [Bacteroidetes bacterium]|nr:glycosyltransferase [Bacteroidota bacterium]